MNTAIVVKNEDTATVMMELEPPDLVLYGVADIGKDLEIGTGYEVVQAVAGCSSIARSAVMAILAVKYPDKVPGLWCWRWTWSKSVSHGLRLLRRFTARQLSWVISAGYRLMPLR